MSVLLEARFKVELRRFIFLSLLFTLPVMGSGALAWAQDAPIADEVSQISEESDRLWNAVTERYQVVVLSRGLLLEPLDEGVELLTIEIVDDRVAIDGESVSEEELSGQIGAENAELVLQLAAMERQQRRSLFATEEAVTDVVVEESLDEADAELEAEATEPRRKHRDSQVAVGSSLTVEEDEVVKEALVFGGPLLVRGKVNGDAVAIGGSVTVSGEVVRDVAAVGGNLTLESGAEVLGDVVSVGGEVIIDDDATVEGQVIEVPFGPNLRFGSWPGMIFGGRHGWRFDEDHFELSPWSVATEFLWEAFSLIVLGLFACLALLIAREPLARVKRRAAREPLKSGLVGLLVLIMFAPLLVLVTLILVISIIGIPLVLLVPFFVLALVLVAFLGFSAVAMGIGELLQQRFGWQISSPYLLLLLGILTIQIWSIIGEVLDIGWGPLWLIAVMFGVFGAVVKFLAWTVGLGAAVLTRFGSAEGWGGESMAVQMPPAAPVAPSDPPAPQLDGSPSPEEPSVLQDPGFEPGESTGDEPRSPDS